MSRGTVFDIKQMAVFDGPGIRTTVFLKGCPLRCQWCHNPEGLEPFPQLMVSHHACIRCGRCEAVCEHPDGCANCFACVDVCPLQLRKIAGTVYTDEALAKILLKNQDILRMNGGGITFSGGEPLMQAGFVLDVIDRLEGMHTAIETSGYCKADRFQRVVNRLDFIMMDIKLIDPERHRHFTGVDNRLILENLERLKGTGKPFVIRIPLIPGVNDTEENLTATAKLLIDVESLQKVELLPYHQTAGAKYEMLGKEYSPEFDTAREVSAMQSCFESFGIPCTVL